MAARPTAAGDDWATMRRAPQVSGLVDDVFSEYDNVKLGYIQTHRIDQGTHILIYAYPGQCGRLDGGRREGRAMRSRPVPACATPTPGSLPLGLRVLPLSTVPRVPCLSLYCSRVCQGYWTSSPTPNLS